MKKKLLSLLLSMAMILSLLPVSVLAVTEQDLTNAPVTTFDELKDALANSNDGDIITIDGTIMVTQTLNVVKNITLTGGTLKRDSGFLTGPLVRLNSPRDATLEVSFSDITLDGDNIQCTRPASLILFGSKNDIVRLKSGTNLLNNISSGGGGAISDMPMASELPNTVVIEDGVLIANNENTGGFGGAIGPWGVIIIEMYGGVVKNNRGVNGSAFYLTDGNHKILGGEIIDNSETRNVNLPGAVALNYTAQLTLGGDVTITGNTTFEGNEANLGVNSLDGATVCLEQNITGKIGITVDDVSNFNDTGIFDNGYAPDSTMPQSSLGSNAVFFSDDSDYITRLEETEAGNKIILGLPQISYYLRGGSFTDSTEESFTTNVNEIIPQPSDPTFTGHEFKGWYSTNDTAWADSDKFDFSTPIGKDYNFYARWLPEVYTVSFDPNGGNGAMDEIYYDFNGNADLPANTFTRAGYIFSGWNTQADGNGTALADQQQDYAPGNQNVTLYAQWELEKYQVNFDPTPGTIGGSADVVTLEYSGGSSIASADLPADPVSEDYNFLGWYLDVDDESTKLDTANLPTVNGDMTYYAKWEWKPEKDPSNPQLSGLDITVDNTLIPFVFDPDTYKYDVTLASIADNMKVKPTAQNPDATFEVFLRSNGRPAQKISGPDADGNYIITADKFVPDDIYYVDVVVFSADGTQSVTYTVAFSIGNVLHIVTDKDGTGAPPQSIAAGGLTEAYPLDKMALGNPIVGVDENGAPKTISTQTDDFVEVQLRANDIPVLAPDVTGQFETAKAANQVIADYMEFTLHVVVKDKSLNPKGNVLV